ncbi:MAG: ROK family protein [Phycisphaerales bacterium]|nr:ROK family protein [Phycisphaerales bacterium]
MTVRTGVDLGGTKIEAVVLDGDDRVLARERCATPQGDCAATVQALADLVARVEFDAGCAAAHVGIGGPGSVSPRTGLHRNANSTVLNAQPLHAMLQTALGRPVALANDANCLALSEAHDGAGAGHRCVFAVILGTGVGGGLVIDGVLHEGHNRTGGEFGHTALPRLNADEIPGPPCYCGQRGCLENWLSGPALEAQWLVHHADALQATEIAATRGDDVVFTCWLDRLARALAGVVTLIDPDVIVVGGGLSAIEQIYTQLPARLPPLVFGGECTTEILRAVHGDSSGVLGAARLPAPA